jgi:disulfide bond formation protein DsbB
MRDPLGKAKALALLAPAGLLAGAYGFQYVWARLYPCEMCWWQRYAHMAALAFALLALLLGGRLPDRGRSMVWLAALAILASGAIGVYHAGVEAHIFPGFTQCTSLGGTTIAEIMAAPVVRCDQVQWAWLGVSMAGWNAILSLGCALVILWLSLKRPRAR